MKNLVPSVCREFDSLQDSLELMRNQKKSLIYSANNSRKIFFQQKLRFFPKI